MSFSDIPGSERYIGVTREEAGNLLLTAIAQEEAGLSKLMDAERNKILYAVNRYRQGKSDLREILNINKSVNNTMKNMIKYQMLLQIKLESVKEMFTSSQAAASAATACHSAKTATAKCNASAKSPYTACTASTCFASTCSDPAGTASDDAAPKCSKPENSPDAKKCFRCMCRPRMAVCKPRKHQQDTDEAFHPVRKKVTNQKAAILRTLLFCFLPFRFFM